MLLLNTKEYFIIHVRMV